MAYFRTIGGKISVLLGGLLILSMFTFVYFSTASLKERLSEQGTDVMLEKANLAKKLVETFHENNIKSANSLYEILLGSFEKFNRVDSMNLPVEGIDAPAITSGPHILNNDFTIVDEFTKKSGAVATVFGKVGDDFLRVSTSLRKSDGTRAVGTMLGMKSPAYEPIMKGETYMGTAHLFGQDYMTRYSPIYNANKELIGILFIGYNFTKELKELREVFATMRRGNSGFFFVLNTKNETVEIHPKDASKSYKGIEHYENIVKNPNSIHKYNYEGVNRIAATTAFEPLHWIVASSNDVDDFMGMASKLEKNLAYSAFLLMIGLIALNTYLTSRMIAKPLHVLKEGVADIASGEGDLTKMMDESSKDEISLVSQQINNFINKVRSIIGEIKNISSENSSIAHQFSTSVMETGKRVEETTSLVNETTRDSQKIQLEMESSIQEAKVNKEELSGAVHYLDEANESIVHLNSKIQQSVSTEIELARRMEQLSNEAGEVKNVLTVISDIAEQTNLLALNAAIEAARAGEHGKGFAVVADEVRKLAERTQKSLAEINSTINVIVQSISESSETMNVNATNVGELANVSDNVQVKISEMSKAMQKAIQMSEKTVNDYIQSGEKVNGIIQTITKINTLSSENARSIEEMASAANHLGSMGEALDSKLNQFRT